MKKSSAIFIGFILFYGIQFIASFFLKTPSIDFGFLALFITIMFLFHLKYKVPYSVPLFLGLAFVLHTIGFYNFIQYPTYYGDLYGAPELNFHYDWAVHFSGMLFGSLALCSLFYRKIKVRPALVITFLVLIMLGIGSIIEISEYVGYSTIGYGAGFLGYGDGDYSPKEGPWANASMDMVMNLFGSLAGVLLYTIFKKNANILEKRNTPTIR